MNRFCFLFAALTVGAGLVGASVTYQYTTTAINYTGAGTVDTSGTCTANTVNSVAASYCIDFASSVSNTEYVLAYSGVTNETGTAGAPPIGTGDTFGFFEVFCETTGTSTQVSTCGSASFSGDLSINVAQTLPAVSSGQFVDALSGGYTNVTTGAGVLTFATTSFNYLAPPINLFYVLQQPTTPVDGYILNNPGSVTSIQGVIINENANAPEPGTLATLGAGLAVLGLISRRRRT
jgi:hypothetical protein